MKILGVEILRLRKDGGPESHVWGWFLLAIKSLFSIVLLRFENGSRDAYHSHAFNCFSWVLRGELHEYLYDDDPALQVIGQPLPIVHRASWLPFVTRRDTFHMVISNGCTWVLSFRGPWAPTWQEYIPAQRKLLTFTWGRKVLAREVF